MCGQRKHLIHACTLQLPQAHACSVDNNQLKPLNMYKRHGTINFGGGSIRTCGSEVHGQWIYPKDLPPSSSSPPPPRVLGIHHARSAPQIADLQSNREKSSTMQILEIIIMYIRTCSNTVLPLVEKHRLCTLSEAKQAPNRLGMQLHAHGVGFQMSSAQ